MALPESAMLYEIAKGLGDRDSGLILEFGTFYGTSAMEALFPKIIEGFGGNYTTRLRNWLPKTCCLILRQGVMYLNISMR